MANEKLLGPVEHVVVLMFENRSFDNVLGGLRPHGPNFDGVPSGWCNPNSLTQKEVPAFQAPTGKHARIMPSPDPQESHANMMLQIYNGTFEKTMKGFVNDYATVKDSDPKDIMQYYSESNMPITHALANTYAVSDKYHGSGPVQTWPNRIFAHCATPDKNGNKSYLNNSEYPEYPLMRGQLPLPSIFEKLDAVKGPDQINWKVYYDGEWPISTVVNYVHKNWSWFSFDDGNVFKFRSEIFPDFFSDVENGTLPTYSFIEPRYTELTLDPFKNHQPNSNHPGSKLPVGDYGQGIDVIFGEQLLKEVYESLAGNPELFKKTLLIVTYDEHGGLSDHVPPPKAVSPFETPVKNFDYKMFGPRVPALFINPYIKSGSVLRPDQPNKASVFDHTSIIASLREHFNLGGCLTPRDDNAPVFKGLVDINNGTTPDAVLPELDLPSSDEWANIPFDIAKAEEDSMHYVMYHAVDEMKRLLEEKESGLWHLLIRFLKKLFSFFTK